YSRSTGKRLFRGAPSGMYSVTASLIPSRIGIDVCCMTKPYSGADGFSAEFTGVKSSAPVRNRPTMSAVEQRAENILTGVADLVHLSQRSLGGAHPEN